MTEYPVDWRELLCRLRARTGRSLAWIARRVAGMDERSINRLAREGTAESRIGFQQGLRLLDYAADHLRPEDWEAIRGIQGWEIKAPLAGGSHLQRATFNHG